MLAGLSISGLRHQHRSHAVMRAGEMRRDRQCAGVSRVSARQVVAGMTNAPKQHPEIRREWCNLNAAPDRRNGLVVPLQRVEQKTKLMERESIRRLALDGALQTRQCVFVAAGFPKRDRKLGIEHWIAQHPCRALERFDRLLITP